MSDHEKNGKTSDHQDVNEASGVNEQKTDAGSFVLNRRDLLSRLSAVGAGALATVLGGGIGSTLSVGAAKAETGQKSKFQYGMVIDTPRCVGCKACVAACKGENKTPPGVYYNLVLESAIERPFDEKPVFMTKPCFHCEKPACVDVCPVGATFKRERDGLVEVDYERCIGCRYCITNCPYGARTFDFGENYPAVEERTPFAKVPSPEYNQFRVRDGHKSPVGNVRKCTFCAHQQDSDGKYNQKAGRWPACAKTCTGHAIFFGDFKDPESDVSRLLKWHQTIRLKEELGTHPNVYYLI